MSLKLQSSKIINTKNKHNVNTDVEIIQHVRQMCTANGAHPKVMTKMRCSRYGRSALQWYNH